MPKSIMDWLAVATLWFGTAILAIKTGDLPLMKGAPEWLASPVWGYAPLALVTLGGVLLFVSSWLRRPPSAPVPQAVPGQALVVSPDATAPVIHAAPRPSFFSNDELKHRFLYLVFLLLMTVSFPLTSAITSCAKGAAPPPPPPPEGPPIFTPTVLRGPLPLGALGQTNADFSRLIGQRTRIMGSVHGSRTEHGKSGKTLYLSASAERPSVYMTFDTTSGDDFAVGDHIMADCAIAEASTGSLGLTDCKVLSPRDWAKP